MQVIFDFFNQFILHVFYFKYLTNENQYILIHLLVNLFF